VVLDRK